MYRSYVPSRGRRWQNTTDRDDCIISEIRQTTNDNEGEDGVDNRARSDSIDHRHMKQTGLIVDAALPGQLPDPAQSSASTSAQPDAPGRPHQSAADKRSQYRRGVAETVFTVTPASRQDKDGKDDEEGREDTSGPRGTFFDDGQRRIDFVLSYEKSALEDHTHQANGKNTDRRRSAGGGDEQRRQYFMSNMTKTGLELEIEEQRVDGSTGKTGHGKLLGFVKIHAPWTVLCREAEILRMKMPLILDDLTEDDRNEDKPKRAESFWARLWNLRFLEQYPDDNAKQDRITWPFNRKRMDRFDVASCGQDNFFSVCQRTEIVWEIMQQCRNDPSNEKRRGVEALLEHNVFSEAYPLHDGGYDAGGDTADAATQPTTSRQILFAQWANWKCTFRPQPLNRIRNYFGEKVGFYFAFMDFYTKMLVFPSVFGLGAFIYGLVSTATSNKPLMDLVCSEEHEPGNFIMCPICKPPLCAPFLFAHEGCPLTKWEYRLDNEGTLVLSCLTIVWCALFLKFWKRREAGLAAQWDTSDMGGGDDSSAMVIRPAFEERAPQHRQHPVTMEMEPHIPVHFRVVWISASILATLFLLILAGVCLTGLIISRIQMYGAIRNLGGPFAEYSVEFARYAVHGLIFVMVMVFETGYHRVADKLTELECPKTPREFLTSLLWKVFIFALFVDFLPIAYAAWFKGRSASTPLEMNFISEICEPTGCMGEVVELVSILLLCRLVFGNIGEVGIPFLTALLARIRASRKSNESNSEGAGHSSWPQYLKDYHLNRLELDGVAEEYMEMMIQLSFVVFFVPALPLAPLLCLLNNIAEIRVDALNFVISHRRPLPVRVPGIQIWNKFMDIILKVGVLCNAALIAFTGDVVPRLYYKYGSGLSNGSYIGYPQFVLSTVDVEDWPSLRSFVHGKRHELRSAGAEGGGHGGGKREDHMELLLANMTKCYYLDMRHPEPPYERTENWWIVLCLRLATFAAFVVTFYVLIFLSNFLISDTPKSVEQRVKRRRHIVTKALDTASDAMNRWKRGVVIKNGTTSVRSRRDRSNSPGFNETSGHSGHSIGAFPSPVLEEYRF